MNPPADVPNAVPVAAEPPKTTKHFEREEFPSLIRQFLSATATTQITDGTEISGSRAQSPHNRLRRCAQHLSMAHSMRPCRSG